MWSTGVTGSAVLTAVASYTVQLETSQRELHEHWRWVGAAVRDGRTGMQRPIDGKTLLTYALQEEGGIKVCFYHGGMTTSQRIQSQNRWFAGTAQVRRKHAAFIWPCPACVPLR